MLNKNRWDQAIGSIYKTVDGRSVMIVAYAVRLSQLDAPGTIMEDLHGALIDELVGGKAEPIKDFTKWQRLLFDGNGAHKGGDIIATPTLDLVSMKRGAR